MIALISAGHEPIAPASPAPFDAERIGLARHIDGLEQKAGRVLGARQRVVHQAGADELSRRWLINRVFHQRLADALHRATMHLAVEHDRIERHAEVVHHDIVDDLESRRCRDRSRLRRCACHSDMSAARRVHTSAVRDCRVMHALRDLRTRSRDQCRRPAPRRLRFP